MRIRHLILIGLTIGLSSSSVCAETFVEWYQRTYKKETHFGASYKAAKSGQVLNSEAGQNQEPVCGLDGQAAELTLEKYRQSFSGSGEAPIYPIRIQTPIKLE